MATEKQIEYINSLIDKAKSAVEKMYAPRETMVWSLGIDDEDENGDVIKTAVIKEMFDARISELLTRNWADVSVAQAGAAIDNLKVYKVTF